MQEFSENMKHFKSLTDTTDSSTLPQVMTSEEAHNMIGQVENYKFTFFITKYLNMTNELCKTLATCNSKILVERCESLMASDTQQIPLFSHEIVKKSDLSSAIIQKLALQTNWSDHSILYSIVEVCNVPEAAALLTEFNSGIDPSQPLMKYPIPTPSHHMIPYGTSTHTVLAVQLNLQLHQTTFQSVIDTRSLIQEKCEVTPHCLQLLAVAKTSHTIIYWTIPKHVASLITSKVQQYQSDLHQNGIQQISVYPGAAFVIGSALTVGLFSFFTEVSFNISIIIILIIIHYR